VRFRATHTPAAPAAPITGDSGDIDIQANALDHFGSEIRGADRAGSRFELTVIAQDADDNTVTGFTGNVTLNRVLGTAYAAGPPPAGVLVETAPATAGNAHAFVAADHGRFTFLVTPHTAETVRFQAVSGAVSSNTPDIAIESGLFTHFQVQVPGGAQANVPFNVTVTAQDAANNTVTGFLGTVTLSLSTSGAAGPFAAIGGASHTYVTADAGRHVYNVTLPASGPNRVIRVSDGNITNDSASFNVAP
jgi:hypothetical protein